MDEFEKDMKLNEILGLDYPWDDYTDPLSYEFLLLLMDLNLPDSAFELMANRSFDIDQIGEILKGLACGLLSEEDVAKYATPIYNWKQMREIRYGLLYWLPEEYMPLFLNPELSAEQMEQVVEGLEFAVPGEAVAFYARPCFSVSDMTGIREALERGVSLNKIKDYFNSSTKICKKYRSKGWKIKEALTDLQMIQITDPRFKKEQLEEIKSGFNHGLSYDDILLYANPDIDALRMSVARHALMRNLPKEEALSYIDESFTDDQLKAIRSGLSSGVSSEKVDFYAKEKYTGKQMKAVKEALSNGFSIEQIKQLGTTFNGSQMHEIFEGALSGLSKEQIEEYAKLRIPSENMKKERIKIKRRDGMAFNKYDFTTEQLREIKEGYNEELSMDQLKLFAIPDMRWQKMRLIRTSFKEGMPEEQIRVFAKNKHKLSVMKEIKAGFEHGLTKHQVLLFANRSKPVEIQEIRLGLEHGLSEEQVNSYANAGLSAVKMQRARLKLEEEMKKEKETE